MTTADASLVTPAFVTMMAAYNGEMNRRLYGAAERLPAQERTRNRGAFWGSIHATLAHVLWGDRVWMSRFDGWPSPAVGMKEAPHAYPDFTELARVRYDTDAKIADWAQRLTPGWLAEDLVWFSAAAQRELRMGKSKLVTHFFNHQTHHRGQAHAMITASGEQTGDTDLFLIV